MRNRQQFIVTVTRGPGKGKARFVAFSLSLSLDFICYLFTSRNLSIEYFMVLSFLVVECSAVCYGEFFCFPSSFHHTALVSDLIFWIIQYRPSWWTTWPRFYPSIVFSTTTPATSFPWVFSFGGRCFSRHWAFTFSSLLWLKCLKGVLRDSLGSCAPNGPFKWPVVSHLGHLFCSLDTPSDLCAETSSSEPFTFCPLPSFW